MHLTMPVLVDSKREIYSKFANSSIPRNYIIGKDGKVLYASVGFKPEDLQEMLALIKGDLGLPGGVPSGSAPFMSRNPSPLQLSKNEIAECKYESAITRLKGIIAKDPKAAQAHYMLGVTYACLKQYDKAAESYRAAFNTASDQRLKDLAKLALAKIHRPVQP